MGHGGGVTPEQEAQAPGLVNRGCGMRRKEDPGGLVESVREATRMGWTQLKNSEEKFDSTGSGYRNKRGPFQNWGILHTWFPSV